MDDRKTGDGSGAASLQQPRTATSSSRPESSSVASSGATAATVGLPALSAPKGGGAVHSVGEKFSANSATGTASLTVPVATSPGRNGFSLALQLAYDSGNGNGPFGLGWNLDVASISRKTNKGIPRYADGSESDVFIISNAEDLVPVGSDRFERARARDDEAELHEFRIRSYRPRVEGGFARIERWTHEPSGLSHWRTTTGTNVLNVYGRGTHARIADPDDPARVFAWLLEETRDDRGNIVRYTYKGEDASDIVRDKPSETHRFADGAFRATAQRYLKRIEYGNERPDDAERWMFEVVFDYGEHDGAAPAPAETRRWTVRSDAFSTYRPGFEIRTYRLCRRILMFHRFDALGPEPYLVRSTDFTYDERGHLSTLARVTHNGYVRDERTGEYHRSSLPPLDLNYTERTIHGRLQMLDPHSLDGIPGGVDGIAARWVDLDGEGIPGVLLPHNRGWYYKSNLGHGRLSPPALLRTLPVPAAVGAGVQQLTDVSGDGRLDLVQYAPPLAGYFERTPSGDWTAFAPFRTVPRIDWRDPNLRFLDVDGDGIADVLITRDDAVVWYRSRGKAGFEGPLTSSKPADDARGPAVIFADRTETIHVADMSGDGLMDIVRVRNGEVCYWPNLGYGRFGAKITLDDSPWFDEENHFDPARIRLADLDGSGTIDLVYLRHSGVRLYFNESGNRLSQPFALALPLPHSASTVDVVDLLGSGTACIVWSSALPSDGNRRVQYVDLMGGRKPHVLERFRNGMGAETRLAYTSSTALYLEDKAGERPWITRLSFPVHVVERVERVDHVAGTRLVTRYRYHHGYFDTVEREYRGFAFVERWDAESIGGETARDGLFPDALDDVHDELRLPPVHTKTWFHTGAWLEQERLEAALSREYYSADRDAPRLVQPAYPARLSLAEEREAARALRGRILREEIYADDGLAESAHPYSVTASTYEVRLLERRGYGTSGEGHAWAVFYAHARENMSLQYERHPDDPRIGHDLVLDVDDFGNVLRAVSVAYPRRKPVHAEQQRLWAQLSEYTFANRSGEASWYRIGVPIGAVTSELTGLPSGRTFTVDAMRRLAAEAVEIPFESSPGAALQKRVLSGQRALYYRDDLQGALAPGHIESRALPYQSFNEAFTTGLLARVYGGAVDDEMLASEGKYVHRDGGWWAPSARLIFDADAFYQPVAAVDPFGQRSAVRYDAMALLVAETQDALDNTVTAGNDYRVLAPKLVTDANANRTAAVFDAFGMPVRIAVMGKAGADEGDTLDDPTTRIEYDLERYVKTGGAQPAFVHTFSREKHGADNPRWQESFSYFDGSGRVAMQKLQAARDERDERERWIGFGRVVFDNKGNPVKKYEPFYSHTPEFERERELVEWGVTPVLRYDPLSRLIRTDLPAGTFRTVSFHAWGGETWDENDTVLESRWYRERGAPDPGEPEPRTNGQRRAAWLAAQHARTPSRDHLDGLGRSFLHEVDNRDARGLYGTRTERDVSGNVLSVIDARGNRTLDGQLFDMLGRPLLTASADAGWSRVFPDMAGNAVRAWDARGHALRYRYDALRRPTHVFARAKHGSEKLVGLQVYGETAPDAIGRNLRTRTHRTYDGAGVTTNERFDFKGNLARVSRKLATTYRETVDWSPLGDLTSPDALDAAENALVEDEVFTATAEHDALSRAVSETAPDGSVVTRRYDEVNRLIHVDVAVRDADEPTTFVESAEYNARGQRTRIVRGNATVSSYEYDPDTFLLEHVTTARGHAPPLQDLRYECDPVGNVVRVRDAVSYGNDAVPADGLYRYDPLYRLTHAEGREHPGQQPSAADSEKLDLAHPHDFQALRRYGEEYRYDPAGNIERTTHRSHRASAAGWVRRYAYAESSNRLVRTSAPNDGAAELSEEYRYDRHGNMSAMPHLSDMRWDYGDRLVSANLRGGGHVYFTYDAAGKRARKVYEHSGLVEERVYLGPFETYRKRRKGDDACTLERQTLHVMDGMLRVAIVETKTVDDEAPTGATSRTRYQLDNHLGSSLIEVDESARVISYEEYFPFGATAVRARCTSTEASAKRYRYTGKERDEETGLYYHGARYYAAWLGRWTACDPAGSADGFNLYRYARNNPIAASDPTGREWYHWVIGAAVVIVLVAAVVVTAGAAAPAAAAAGTAALGTAEVATVTVATTAVVTADAALTTGVVVGGTELVATGVVATTTEVVATGLAAGGTELVAGGVAATSTELVAGGVAATSTEVVASGVAATSTEVVASGVAATSTELTASGGVSLLASNAAPVAGTVVAAASTPQGQQLIEEGVEVLESAAPAIEGELQVASQQVQSLAQRTFSSSDPLVADLANKIEAAYPGHVVDVNVPLRNAAGQLITDVDILLENAAIQVKSGSGVGLTRQLFTTEAATGLPTIGYGPDLGGSVVRGIQSAGGLVTRSEQLLIEVVAPTDFYK